MAARKPSWTVVRYAGQYYESAAYYGIGVPDKTGKEELPADHTFEAELVYDQIVRLNSSGFIIRFKDVNNPQRLFAMMPKAFDSIVPELVDGKIKGIFGLEARGTQWGIKLIKKL